MPGQSSTFRIDYPGNISTPDNNYQNIMAISVQGLETVPDDDFFRGESSNTITNPGDRQDGESISGQAVRQTRMRRAGRQLTLPAGHIYLPAPENITFNDQLTWENGNLGGWNTLQNNSGNGFQDLIENSGRIAGDVLSSVLANLPSTEELKNTIEFRDRRVRNPHMELLFKQPNFRTFSFSYKLIPYSEDDCNTIYDLIKLLRWAASPGMTGAGLFERSVRREAEDATTADNVGAWLGGSLGTQNWFSYPHYFDAEILVKKPDGNIVRNPWLPKFRPMALTSFSCNYTPNGFMTAHANGMPTQVDMTIEFTEIELNTKGSIAAGY